MANTKKPAAVIQVEFETKKKQLEEINNFLTKIKSEGKLNNADMRVFNSIIQQSTQLIAQLDEAINSGVDATKLKAMKTTYNQISTQMAKMASRELSLGQTTEEYNKQLKIAQEQVDKLAKEYDELKKKREAALINKDGKVKQTAQEEVAKQAVTASRGGRRGANTKAEQMVIDSKGDMTDIKKKAAEGDKDAIKALEIWNKQVQKLQEDYAKLTNQINQARTALNDQKTAVTELKNQPGGFDQKTVDTINAHSASLKANAIVMEDYAKGANETATGVVKQGDAIVKADSAIMKATTSFIKANVVLKTLKNMLKQGIETVKQMDVALTNMAVVTGKTRQEIRKYVPELRALALESSTSLTDIANLTAEFVRQGRTMKDAMILSEQAAKAAKIAGISASDSLKYMTSAINGFNLAASDALRVNDLFAKLGADSATDYEQLAVALSKVSAQANTAGMSIEFTTALLAKGIETTQEAPESIGTALKTIIARMREITDYGDSLDISSPINKVEKALASAGVALRDEAGQFKDLEQIFTELGPKWDSLNTMQQQAIAQAVAGTRQQSRFLAIMQDWDRTIQLSASATDAAGASMYQYQQYANSMEGAVTNLTTAWQGFVQNLANTDFIINIINAATDAINGIVKAMEWLNSIKIFGGDQIIGTITLISIGILTIKEVWEKFQEHQNRSVELLNQQNEILRQIAEQNMTDEQRQQKALEQQQQENELLKEKLTLTERITKMNEQFDTKKKAKQEQKELIKNEKLKIKEDKKTKKTKFKEEKKQTKKREKEIKAELKRRKKEQVELDVQRNESFYEGQDQIDQRKNAEIAFHKTKQKQLYDQYKGEYDSEEFRKAWAEENEQHERNMYDIQADQLALEQRQQATKDAQIPTQVLENELQETKKKKIEQQNKGLGKQAVQLGKNLLINIKDTIVNAAKAVAQMAIPMAIAAVGMLAVAGISGLAGIIGKASGDNSAAISENQNKIYENKEKSKKIDSLTSEYQKLFIKQQAGTLTLEERDRMSEIEDELKEIDENISGTGQALIDSATEVSNSFKEENKKLIKENYDMIKKNTGGLTADQIQLGVSQYAELQLQESEEYKQLSDADKQKVLNEQANIMAGFDYDKYQEVLENNSGWDKLWGTKDAKEAENWGKAMDEMTAISASLARDMNAARQKEGENLQDQIQAFNTAMEQATTEQAKEAIKGAYGTLAVLAEIPQETMDNINEALINSKEWNTSDILELTATLTSLGNNASSVAAILTTLTDNISKLGNVAGAVATYAEMLTWTDEDWERNYMGDLDPESEEGKARQAEIDQMKADGTWESYKTQTKDAVRNNIAGYDVTKTMERVTTHQESQKDTADIISTLQDGEELSTDQLSTLAADYGGLMANPEFVDALTNDKAKAAQMIADAQEQMIEDQIKSYEIGQQTIQEDIKASEERLRSGDLTDEQRNQELAKLEQLRAQYNANELAIASLANQYTKIDKYANSIAKTEAEISALQKEMDKHEQSRVDAYQKMWKLQQQNKDLAQQELGAKWESVAAAMHLTGDLEDYYDIIDGQIIPNEEKMAGLTDRQRGYLLDNVDAMQEYQDVIQEAIEAQEELAQASKDQALAIQEQAIAAMQARLDAEYEATQQSLEKRQELYEKYFDELEQEESTEDYENDRQALLNKIAALSTATDSASLAKLKEAQEALAELDEEQLQSERDLRREAVEENFEKQGEDLDAAYENAMNNVEGLWQEFVNMQKEDQEALFKQYGDEFQNVTALAAEVAAENLSHFLDAVEGRGIMQPDGTVHKYAEGGLVDFTGPAWVDGSKTSPEAFLDPEDTANIGMLAQGLRAMVGNIFNRDATSSAELSDVSTLNIEEFNINVGLGSNMIDTGKDIADGFMKAIRELGININKQG